jgi:SAM-dependent methyltransferase
VIEVETLAERLVGYARGVDRAARYSPSHALELRVTPEGALIGQTSISGTPQALTPDLLLALLAFAGGVDVETAIARLEARFGVDRDEFRQSFEHLLALGFVIPAGAAAAPPATGFFADLLRHTTMVADGVRVAAYRDALAIAAPGRRVLDLGTGSGLLALLAARAGARAVIAVEEAAIADLAAQNFAAAGFLAIELIRRPSRDVVLDQPADVIVHELFGNDPLAEGLLPSICDARRRLLAPGGALVPHRVEILCVGVDTGGVARDRARALAAVAGIPDLAGALAPLAAAVDALPARAFIQNVGDVPFTILTEPARLHDLDLARVDEDACAAAVIAELRVVHAGRLDALVTYFRAHLGPGVVLTNAPGAPPTHWDRRVTAVSAARAVQPGEAVAIHAWREAALKHEQLVVDRR